MSITIQQNLKAIAPNIITNFGCVGAVGAKAFSVLAGGAGGVIDASTGVYTAPQLSDYNPKKFIDTIQVEDSEGTKATTTIMVLPHLGLLAHIIQIEMGLQENQVQLYQQKYKVPNDERIYVAVGMLTAKAIASKKEYVDIETGLNEVVTTNWRCNAWIEIYSSTNLAFLRKEEVAAAIGSTYSEQIQEANNFKIGKLPGQFNNVSSEQGPGIPYRFNITVPLLYTVSKTKPVPYFDNYEQPQFNVDD